MNVLLGALARWDARWRVPLPWSIIRSALGFCRLLSMVRMILVTQPRHSRQIIGTEKKGNRCVRMAVCIGARAPTHTHTVAQAKQ